MNVLPEAEVRELEAMITSRQDVIDLREMVQEDNYKVVINGKQRMVTDIGAERLQEFITPVAPTPDLGAVQAYSGSWLYTGTK